MTVHVSANTGCNLGCTYTTLPDQRVLTADLKWVKMQDLGLGDEVVSFTPPEDREKGEHLTLDANEVYEYHEHEKETVRVTTTEGTVEVAAKHPFLSKYHGWREAKDFKPGQEIRFLVSPEDYEETDEYQLGYVVGAWRGDGTVFADTPTIRCNDKEIPETVATLSESIVETDYYESYREAHGQEIGIAACRDKTQLVDVLSSDKGNVSDEFARGWLAGMFDTDGAFTGKVVRFCQTKEDNREKLKRFLDQLGYGYEVEDKTIRPNGGYGAKFNLLTEIRPKVSRKVRNYIGRAWKGSAEVESVESLGVQRVCDVAVENHHTLCVEGFMSMNCYEEPDRQHSQAQIDSEYDLDAIFDRLKQFRQSYPNDVPGMHGGEPMLLRDEHLEEIFAWIYEEYGLEESGERTHIQSNGTLIEEHHIEMFREYNVNVGISCDGPAELNEARKARSEMDGEMTDVTDSMTQRTLDTIDMLAEADGVSGGIIVVLTENNAGDDEKLETLLDWMDTLCKGNLGGHYNPAIPYEDVQEGESLSPQRLKEVYLRTWEWMKAKPYRRWGPMKDYQDNLLGNDLSNCVNNKCDVFNAGAAKIAKGDGSTTGCGKTWAMAGDGNAFLQGDSTGNEYDKTEERYEMLKQVPGPYTEGEEDHGGCKGCKYWNVCQGGCPSAALDYDYRNRTRWCEAKYALYEQIERDMKALFPGLRTITEAPWDAPLADGAGGRGKNIQPFAGMHHGESEDPSVFGGQTDASPVWSAATDGLSFEETAEMYREYYPEETLTIDQDEGTIHSDTA